jgi:hypothetical protein
MSDGKLLIDRRLGCTRLCLVHHKRVHPCIDHRPFSRKIFTREPLSVSLILSICRLPRRQMHAAAKSLPACSFPGRIGNAPLNTAIGLFSSFVRRSTGDSTSGLRGVPKAKRLRKVTNSAIDRDERDVMGINPRTRPSPMRWVSHTCCQWQFAVGKHSSLGKAPTAGVQGHPVRGRSCS